MYTCRITVVRKAEYPDLSAKYENPIENHCSMAEGQVFLSESAEMPEGFCASA